jgi:hypothetical protein
LDIDREPQEADAFYLFSGGLVYFVYTPVHIEQIASNEDDTRDKDESADIIECFHSAKDAQLTTNLVSTPPYASSAVGAMTVVGHERQNAN